MFGWNTQVFDGPTQNLLERVVSRISVTSFASWLKISVVSFCPGIADKLGISVFDLTAQEFFRTMIAKTITEREDDLRSGQPQRDDFIDLMMDGHEEGDTKFELIEDTAAQGMILHWRV